MQSRFDIYVIECRNPDGSLDLRGRQPEEVFGAAAYNGISTDAMAKRIYRDFPDAALRGETISAWPSIFEARWRARRKYW
jgi:hypothetical protein